jgi:hypothetical protein
MSERLLVRVIRPADGDDAELAELAADLRGQLLGLDVDAVEPLAIDEVPEGSKGLGAAIGWLTVQLGMVTKLSGLVHKVRSWTRRTGQAVEISIGGDVLKVTGPTAEQQERIIDAWLSRHAADS